MSDMPVDSDRMTGHALVPVSRRPIPIIYAPVIVLGACIYATLASINPVFGHAPGAVIALTALFLVTSGCALMSRSGDIFEPLRVVSVYFCVAFAVAPLAMIEGVWDYQGSLPALATQSAILCLACYLMTLVGYTLPIFPPLPERIENGFSRTSLGTSRNLGLMLFFIGLACYVVLFQMSGGIAVLFGDEGGRNTFFFGLGPILWGAAMMFPGATLFLAASSVGRYRGLLIRAIPTMVCFVGYLMLQGRMRALNALLLGVVVTHYVVRPMKVWRLGLFGIGGMLLAFFMGYARQASVRTYLLTNPLLLVQDILSNLGEFLRVFLLGDLSRLRQIMLILGKVPDQMPYDWGASFFVFINPWVRLVGLEHLQTPGIGPRLFYLANPYAPPGILSGYLPSHVGEMLVNFPWYLAPLLFLLYGVVLRFAYLSLIVRRGDVISISVYSVILIWMSNAVLQSIGHIIFEMMVLILPMVAVAVFSRRQRHSMAAPPLSESSFQSNR